MWSTDGQDLFFRTLDGSEILAVPVSRGEPLKVGAPKQVVKTALPVALGNRDRAYAVSPDGQRFLMARRVQDRTPDKLHVTLNWAAELRRAGGAAGRQ